MALNLHRSGYATLEYEIAQEKASALGRLGRRLEAALAALAACPRTDTSDRKIRNSLVERAGYALWLFVVQREACGLNDSVQVMQDYGVPRGVCPHGATCRHDSAKLYERELVIWLLCTVVDRVSMPAPIVDQSHD